MERMDNEGGRLNNEMTLKTELRMLKDKLSGAKKTIETQNKTIHDLKNATGYNARIMGEIQKLQKQQKDICRSATRAQQ